MYLFYVLIIWLLTWSWYHNTYGFWIHELFISNFAGNGFCRECNYCISFFIWWTQSYYWERIWTTSYNGDVDEWTEFTIPSDSFGYHWEYKSTNSICCKGKGKSHLNNTICWRHAMFLKSRAWTCTSGWWVKWQKSLLNLSFNVLARRMRRKRIFDWVFPFK